jgi:hypothetical protein
MFDDLPVFQAEFSDCEPWVVRLSRQMRVQHDQVVVGQLSKSRLSASDASFASR